MKSAYFEKIQTDAETFHVIYSGALYLIWPLIPFYSDTRDHVANIFHFLCTWWDKACHVIYYSKSIFNDINLHDSVIYY